MELKENETVKLLARLEYIRSTLLFLTFNIDEEANLRVIKLRKEGINVNLDSFKIGMYQYSINTTFADLNKLINDIKKENND